VEDTAGEGALATAAVCPTTEVAEGVTDVVITTLAADATVVVAVGLLLATELWLACATFCGDTEDDTSCAVFVFIGDAPASWTTVGVPTAVPCCTCNPLATC